MFPLPGAFLFPGQLLPLHIFEPRYRAMIAASLDGPGRIALATIPDGERETDGHPPAVLEVAGLGEIVRHEKLPDGRYLVWLLGLMRVRLEEVPSEHPYRMARCLPFAEIQPTVADARRLRRRLRAATTARLREQLTLPEETPTGLLADLLVQTLGAPTALVSELFAEPSITERAERALRVAAALPPPAKGVDPMDDGDDASRPLDGPD